DTRASRNRGPLAGARCPDRFTGEPRRALGAGRPMPDGPAGSRGGLRSGKLKRHHHRFETTGLVRRVAERLVARLAAAAQRDAGAPGEPERQVVLIHDLEVSFDPERAVVHHRDSSCRHSSSAGGCAIKRAGATVSSRGRSSPTGGPAWSGEPGPGRLALPESVRPRKPRWAAGMGRALAVPTAF